MTKELKQNILLSFVSVGIALVVFIYAIEFSESAKHEQWKAGYKDAGDWYGKLVTPSDNKKLMWEYNPNSESNVTNLAVIKTNRYGFRDFDYETKEKPSNVYRVSFIGDSTTLGYDIETNDVYPVKFQEYASNAYAEMNVQALNHSVDGYNTIQISEMLKEKVVAFQPDKVVYVMCLNDFDFEDSSGEKTKYFKEPTSFLYQRIERIYREYSGLPFHHWHFKKNKSAVYDEIRSMKSLLSKKGIDFQVVILPVFLFEHKGEFFEGPEHFTNYNTEDIHADIAGFLKSENISYFDLLSAFRETGRGPSYFAQDVWHPNREGMDFIAKALLKPVLEDVKGESNVTNQ